MMLIYCKHNRIINSNSILFAIQHSESSKIPRGSCTSYVKPFATLNRKSTLLSLVIQILHHIILITQQTKQSLSPLRPNHPQHSTAAINVNLARLTWTHAFHVHVPFHHLLRTLFLYIQYHLLPCTCHFGHHPVSSSPSLMQIFPTTATSLSGCRSPLSDDYQIPDTK